MNGAQGIRLDAFISLSVRMNFSSWGRVRMIFHFLSFVGTNDTDSSQCRTKKSLASHSVLNLCHFPPIFARSITIGVDHPIRAEIFHDSSGSNARISRSRSTRSFTATDWTRPAERPERTLRQRTGEASYPTIRSRIRRDCCALTRSRSIFHGFSNASKILSFVIS